MAAGKVLTSADLAQYCEQGFVHVRGLLSAEETERYKARARAITLGDRPEEAKKRVLRDVRFAKSLLPMPADPELAMWKIMNPDRFDATFRAFLTTPKLLDAMEDIVGPDVIAFLLMFIYRPPGVPDADHPFHQDAFYFPFGPHDDVVGLWLPLDDVDEETGSLVVVPGSHTEDVRAHDLPAGVANGACFAIPEADARGGAVTIEAKAGDAVLFHARTWHKAPGNRSKRHRRVITIHAAAASCRMDGDIDHSEFGFTLVRGRLHEGGLQPWNDAPLDMHVLSEAEQRARVAQMADAARKAGGTS